MKHANITIKGKVLRTGFRFTSMQYAIRLGVSGFVKYTPDCDIYIEAEGPADKLDAFINWCRNGPLNAHVKQVSIDWGDPVKNLVSFDIID